jgi:Fe-S-cluster containining protein
VLLVAADVRRLQRALGVPWADFAAVVSAPDDDGFALFDDGPRYRFRLRVRDDASCVFSVGFSRERRCGVHATLPLSCQVYPFHVALGAARPLAALGNDAACPAPHAAAWHARIDDEQPAIERAVAASARDDAARARWHTHLASTGRRYQVEDYLAFTRFGEDDA